jgi:hypothetical protein
MCVLGTFERPDRSILINNLLKALKFAERVKALKSSHPPRYAPFRVGQNRTARPKPHFAKNSSPHLHQKTRLFSNHGHKNIKTLFPLFSTN